MSRLFVANFGFEDELSGRRMSRSAWEATRGLCGCWTPMLGPGDLAVLAPYQGDTEAPAGADRATEVVAWGWSQRMVRLAQEIGSGGGIPDPSVVEALNRRRWSFEQEVEAGMVPSGAVLAESQDACQGVVSRSPRIGSGWIVKADLGASGRQQRRITGDTPPAGFDEWLAGCLDRDGLVVVEPYLESVFECGLQFELGTGGGVRYCGATELLTTESGSYLGTRFGESVVLRLESDLEHLLARLEPVVDRAAKAGYFGPLGIDAMCFRSPTGETAWRPLQEVNARFTMGRCALEWASELPGGASGTVLVCRWAEAESVDRRLSELATEIEGLRRAERFSPPESPPGSPSGLVLLVYDTNHDPGMIDSIESIEGRVMACLAGPAH